eukprot:TRINITY_DN6183_c0_g1_i6.p1 TRINITY_DN6183_c0_g1~~TRINITY_DN6183_c0_g1_i6.p1  ORF type:complete len:799 (-),score=185.79 TRINITY_DN6183_c0_g1_i6:889-3231(-)
MARSSFAPLITMLLLIAPIVSCENGPWVVDHNIPHVATALTEQVFRQSMPTLMELGDSPNQEDYSMRIPCNLFAVKLDLSVNPQDVANELGLHNHGQIGSLKGYYLFEHPFMDAKTQVKVAPTEYHKLLNKQTMSTRSGDQQLRVLGASEIRQVASQFSIHPETVYLDSLSAIQQHPKILWSQREELRRHVRKSIPTDPSAQWHIHNTNNAGRDTNVRPAWTQNYMGQGIQICVIDDGMEITNPELSPGYQAADSYDFNFDDNNPSPGSADNHGTSCAGCAAARDDGTCGVGTAFRASLSALRLISAGVTDATEASALTYKKENNDIYSNSWGPNDDGKSLSGPGSLTYAAFQDGTTNGRGGKGNIYVWAGGNGAQAGDNGNIDGYGNNIFTVSVGGIDSAGAVSEISEQCTCLHVVAPTQGDFSTLGITTTDRTGSAGYVNGACTTDFSGTSASCPIAAGVMALALQRNPNLTWRQLKHLMVYHSKQFDPGHASWITNGAGVKHSNLYGFGLVDGQAYVAAAANYTTAMPAMVTKAGPVVNVNSAIPNNNPTGVSSTYTVSAGDNIYIEHIVAEVTISHNNRGQLRIELTAPSGVVSELSPVRTVDDGNNYNAWPFMTNKHWGEQSQGTWTLKVTDTVASTSGTFTSWKFTAYGTNTAYGVQSGNGGAAPTPTPTPTATATPSGGSTPTPTPTASSGGGDSSTTTGGSTAGTSPKGTIITSMTQDEERITFGIAGGALAIGISMTFYIILKRRRSGTRQARNVWGNIQMRTQGSASGTA